MNSKHTNTKASVVKVTRRIYSDLDSMNRQFVWDLLDDGSAETRELTRHLDYAGSVKITYSANHPAESEMAALIARMGRNEK
jgi:hypothetical protein